MSDALYIARGESELGTFSRSEARELLRSDFLLPDDLFWLDGTDDWKPLAQLDTEPARKSSATGLMKSVQEKVATAGVAAISKTAQFTRKLTATARRGKAQLADSSDRLLQAFTPQIQKLIARQLVERSVTRVQAAMRDDEFMRKLFGATYDCVPKPVYRFVSEEVFIRYCMEHREKLLGLPPPSDHPDSAS